ncbi:MAG TPA: hypothetical protein PKC43_10025 [Phycisphaerales bacterium]|nr:hypothetical protein [Phycisphaerales bacterium]HMP37772.1 hypothetical protein [Phycisphaerales bacterium]
MARPRSGPAASTLALLAALIAAPATARDEVVEGERERSAGATATATPSEVLRPTPLPEAALAPGSALLIPHGLGSAEVVEIADEPRAERIELRLPEGLRLRLVRTPAGAIPGADDALALFRLDHGDEGSLEPDVASESVVAAALSIRDGRVHALITTSAEAWSIEPHPAAIERSDRRHLLARTGDLLPGAFICGATAEEIAVPPPTAAAEGEARSKETEARCVRRLAIALAIDPALAPVGAAAAGGVKGALDQRMRDEAALLMTAVASLLERSVHVAVELIAFGPSHAVDEDGAIRSIGAVYGEFWGELSGLAPGDGRGAMQGESAREPSSGSASRPVVSLLLSAAAIEPIEGAACFGLAWVGGIGGGPAQRLAVACIGSQPSLIGRSGAILHQLAHTLGAAHCEGDGCAAMVRRWSLPPVPLLCERASSQIDALVHRRTAIEAPRPEAPRELRASENASCSAIELAWSAVDGADRYHVWRLPTSDDGSDAERVFIATVSTPEARDETAPIGAPLAYHVVAEGLCGASDASPEVRVRRTPPPAHAVSQVRASDGSACGVVRVTWTPSDGAAAYAVLRNVVNNPSTATEIARAEAPPFDDPQQDLALRWYWVRALDGCGRPGPTGRGDSGVAGSVPPAPTGISATDGTACESVQVSWNPVGGVGRYAVWRSDGVDPASAELLAIVDEPSYEDADAPLDVELRYWISALNACGQSPLGGPDIGRAASAIPLVMTPEDRPLRCGEAFVAGVPALVNASCADPVRWSLVTAPDGMRLDDNARLAWTATAPGRHAVMLRAENDRGATTVAWTIEVRDATPALAVPERIAARCGIAFQTQPGELLNAGCAGSVRWSLEGAPEGLALDPAGTLAWASPTLGTHRVVVAAENSAGVDRRALAIVVEPAAPEIAPPPRITARAALPFRTRGPSLLNEPCSGPVRYGRDPAAEERSGFDVTADGMIVAEAPTAGLHRVHVVAEGAGGVAKTAVEIEIVAPAAPELRALALGAIPCGEAWRGAVAKLVNPVGAGAVRWSLGALPSEIAATIDDSGVVSIARPAAGRIEIEVTAANDLGSATVRTQLTVDATEPPQALPMDDVAHSAGSAFVGAAPRLAPSPCVGAVRWSVLEAPDGVSVDERGVVRWDDPPLGRFRIVLAVTGDAGSDEVAFTLDVIVGEPEREAPVEVQA